MGLWNKEIEISFFKQVLKNFASKEKIFYMFDDEYYAYIPKSIKPDGQTLQSRNSLIGNFTEKWVKDIFEPIAKQFNLYAVNDVVCEEIGLTKQSSADLAFTTTNEKNQSPENIKIIFEIKMSIVSNYKLDSKNNNLLWLGDYKTHRGNPSLLRSDSMLKAIGKSVNIRVSNLSSSEIPIVVLGNSPITESYKSKVDFLKTSGIVQGFLSLYPNPTTSEFIKNSDRLGFQTLSNSDEIFIFLKQILSEDINYFSSMLPNDKLGSIVYEAAKEKTDELRAIKFLELLRK